MIFLCNWCHSNHGIPSVVVFCYIIKSNAAFNKGSACFYQLSVVYYLLLTFNQPATSEGLLINNLYWLFIPLASETLRFTHHDLPIEKQMQFLAKNCSHFCKREKKSPTERTFWNQNQLRTKRIFFAELFFSKNFAGGGKKNWKKNAPSQKTKLMIPDWKVFWR